MIGHYDVVENLAHIQVGWSFFVGGQHFGQWRICTFQSGCTLRFRLE